MTKTDVSFTLKIRLVGDAPTDFQLSLLTDSILEAMEKSDLYDLEGYSSYEGFVESWDISEPTVEF